MLRFVPLIIIVMLMIYCVVDVAQSHSDEVRIAPRWLAAAAVILLLLFGAVTWLFWGRPNAASIAGKAGRYMSIDSGPTAVSVPSRMGSQTGIGIAPLCAATRTAARAERDFNTYRRIAGAPCAARAGEPGILL